MQGCVASIAIFRRALWKKEKEGNEEGVDDEEWRSLMLDGDGMTRCLENPDAC